MALRDSNTSFFAKKVHERQVQNSMLGNIMTNGKPITTREQLCTTSIAHFTQLFIARDQTKIMHGGKNWVLKLVTMEMNHWTCGLLYEQEVEEALKSMKARKAPRPDEFTVEFFQHLWRIIKYDIM